MLKISNNFFCNLPKCFFNKNGLKRYSIRIPPILFSKNGIHLHAFEAVSPQKTLTRLFSASIRAIDPSSLVAERLFIQKDYWETMRRLSFKEKKTLEKEMFSLLKDDHDKFLSLVENASLKEVTQLNNYLNHALAALHEGQISQESFATIVLPSASTDSEIEYVSLFTDEGEINSEARNLIEQTLCRETRSGEKTLFLSTSQLDDFFELMKKENSIEREFALENDVSEGVREVIQREYDINVFSKCEKKGIRKQMIPSAAMMQNLLKVKFGENAIKMNFVLGYSSAEDIEKNERMGKRDVVLCFPGVSLPREIHGEVSLGADFTYHDFFHSILCSSTPIAVRNLFLDIAQKAKENGLNDFFDFFVDLELNEYFHSFVDNEMISSEELLINQLVKSLNFAYCAFFSIPRLENNNAFIDKVKNLVLQFMPHISPSLLAKLNNFLI